jgi:hypothetical protein
MEAKVPLWVPIAVGLASSLLLLLGALGSQLIAARANFKLKKLELLYSRKADAYRDLVINAGTFAHDPWNEDKYLAYLNSYLTALTVASDDVEAALNGRTGVSVNAQRLRTRDYDEMSRVRMGSWYNAMETATKAIRDDLQSLAKDSP